MKSFFLRAIQLSSLLIFSSNITAQDVNPFSGSLNYGTGLFVIPSDKGEGVPLNLNYGTSGIQVMQPASDVGLGWNLSAGGSIYRSVNGFPDDASGTRPNYSIGSYLPANGCLLGATGADILSSRRNLDTIDFFYPNYDAYNVSGPGLQGSISPMLLDYQVFTRDEHDEFRYDHIVSRTKKKAQFFFNGDFS